MWLLVRNLTPGEVRTCKLSGKMIVYGDYYYQDDEDSKLYVKASELHAYERKKREQAFDYSLLERAGNEKEYREYMKRAQREYLAETILNQKIIKNGTIQETSINGAIADKE